MNLYSLWCIFYMDFLRITPSDSSLLVYTYMIASCIFFLFYPADLLNSFISSNWFFVIYFLGFPYVRSYHLYIEIVSFLSSQDTFYFFFLLVSEMLNRSDSSKHLSHVPNISSKILNLLPLYDGSCGFSKWSSSTCL